MFRILHRQLLGRGASTRASRGPGINCQCSKTLSTFQLKKISQEFDNVLDRNKDGYVDKQDVEAFKRTMRTYAADMKQDPVRISPYTKGYEDYWILLYDFADVHPKDGFISREEWISLWEDIVSKAKDSSYNSLPQWVKLMPTGIFPVMDYNNDGVIDELEYRRFWHFVCGYPFISEPRALEMIDIMTEGGKHKLDIKRFEQLYAEFYLSDDENSPSRFIGGPIEY